MTKGFENAVCEAFRMLEVGRRVVEGQPFRRFMRGFVWDILVARVVAGCW